MKKGTKLNRKDESLINLVELFKTSQVDFSSTTVASDYFYWLQVVTDALWYITNNHLTINEARRQKKEFTPIPKLLEGCVGYNEIKPKKVKTMPLSSDLLHAHAQVLYYLLLKPYVDSTGSWKTLSDEMQDLKDCLNNFREYLNRKKADSSKYNKNSWWKCIYKTSRSMWKSWLHIWRPRLGCERGRFRCSCYCKRSCSYSDIQEQYAKAKIFWKTLIIRLNWSYRILPWWLTYFNICRD